MSDAAILRETFEIAVNDPSFGVRFYERLFKEHPEVVPMFKRNSSGAQQKMFAQKLAAIVDAVEDPALLKSELEAVSRSHSQYGVRPEMYDWVGAILLSTLAEAVGSAWNADTERAWRDAYAAITKMVLAA